MIHMTRREKEKIDMRQAILKASVEIILEEGYDKLSMRKIASVIDYTPTTIYLYYKDKAQIIEDIAKEVYKQIVLYVQEVLAQNKNIPQNIQLEKTFKGFIYTMANNAEMSKAVIRSGTKAIFGTESNPNHTVPNGVAMLQKILLEGQKKDIFRKLDDNVSWMIITALLGFSMNAIENYLYLETDWDKKVDIFVEFLIKGLLA